jgi:hypothetical protein
MPQNDEQRAKRAAGLHVVSDGTQSETGTLYFFGSTLGVNASQ